MFGFITRSESIVSFLAAALVASTMLAPAAIAAPFSAGNSFEIPIVPHDRMAQAGTARAYYGAPGGNADEIPLVTHATTNAPKHAAMNARTRQTTPEPVAGSVSNPAATCINGHRWEETAANGWTLPMPCHG